MCCNSRIYKPNWMWWILCSGHIKFSTAFVSQVHPPSSFNMATIFFFFFILYFKKIYKHSRNGFPWVFYFDTRNPEHFSFVFIFRKDWNREVWNFVHMCRTYDTVQTSRLSLLLSFIRHAVLKWWRQVLANFCDQTQIVLNEAYLGIAD